MFPRVSDNFDRANSADLGATWTIQATLPGALQIVSNRVRASATGSVRGEHNTQTLANDQWVQVTLASYVNSAVTAMACVRVSTGARTQYNAQTTKVSPSTVATDLQKIVAGAETTLAARSDLSWATSGDILRCEAFGTTIRSLQNGVVTNSQTDSAVTSGLSGLAIYNGGALADMEFDDFSAGDFVEKQRALVVKQAVPRATNW